MITRGDCVAMDMADMLAPMRARFVLPEGVIYLDGNSLGALPAATMPWMADVMGVQWGRDLIGSWNTHDWIGAPARVGAKIAPLIGAAAGQVLVADTVSINLFKLIAGALSLRPGRRVIVSEAGNFPTDLYMLQGLRDLLGDVELRIVARDDVAAAMDADVALLLLSHVHYRTGLRWDMPAMTRHAQSHGALMLWDLSHSTGAVALELDACNVDLAAGCGYKYLNGGPGAPGFLYVATRHHAAIRSPLTGWLGHASPFTFVDGYEPAAGIRRMLCSSPSILAIAALEAGVGTYDGADPHACEAKAGALGDLFIALVEAFDAGRELTLASPRAAAARGAQVSFAHDAGYPVMQALIARGIIGDFRAPDLIRFGFAPLYVRHVDVWDAAAALMDVLRSECYREAGYQARSEVT